MRYTEKDDIGWAIHGDAVYSDCGAPEGFRGGGIEAFAALEDILYASDGTEIITLDRLRELVAAERDGRVAVLPCKVGDTVWINYTPKHPANPEHKGKWFTREVEIERVKIGVKGLSFQTYLESFALSELGKTVFLTRAEAEQALVRAEAEAKGEQE